MSTVPRLHLNEEHSIPQIGFGTYKLMGNTPKDAVQTALEVGYRHIDTAFIYHNQYEVGQALAEHEVSRENVFLTSKLWRTSFHVSDAKEEFWHTLKELGTDYLDLYLLHWPNSNVPIAESLYALNEVYEKGQLRAIGVSNFTVKHLQDALATGTPIVNNQVEFHPTFWDTEMYEFANENGITLTGYAPIGSGQELENETLQEIAEQHNATVSQIAIAWVMAKGVVAIPRSSNPEHIRENFQAKDVELSDEEVERIDSLNTGERLFAPWFNEFDY